MKKLIFLIILVIGLYSCDNRPIKVSNPESVTTLEILNKADTTCYNIYIDSEETLYVLKDGVVVYRATNDAGSGRELGILIIGLFAVVIILAVTINELL